MLVLATVTVPETRVAVPIKSVTAPPLTCSCRPPLAIIRFDPMLTELPATELPMPTVLTPPALAIDTVCAPDPGAIEIMPVLAPDPPIWIVPEVADTPIE